MIELTNLSQMLALVNSRAKVTVIDFHADWCGPCQTIKPQYERLSSFYDAGLVNFCKCNVDHARDCSAHFNVRAMPTFVVCIGGETIATVQGGDLSAVQRAIELAIGQVQKPQQQQQRTASATGSAGALKDAFAAEMLKVKAARAASDQIAEKDGCDAALQLLWAATEPSHLAATRGPFGALMLPYLASDAFSAAAVSALLGNISRRPQPACYDGELIVTQCLRYIVQMIGTCTWSDVEFIRLMHTAVLSLLQVPEAQHMVARSIYFFDPATHTGVGLESFTLIGALFGIGPVANGLGGTTRQRGSREWQALLQMFPATQENSTAAHDQAAQRVQHTVELLASMNKRLTEALLQARPTRDATLRFFGRALELNEDYQKTMHHDSPLSSRYFMLQLQSALVEVALPVFTRGGGSGFDPSTIPASYLLEDSDNRNHRSLVNFGKDIERVAHFDDAHPLPTFLDVGNNSCGGGAHPEPFKPAVHLFFLAARAITLCAVVFIDAHESSARSARHPAVAADQRDFYVAEKMLYEGLMGSRRLGGARMQFLNGLAQWLLHIMGVSRATGELPAVPSAEWNYLPQQLIDCVIHATSMAPIDPLYVNNMLSLLLVLMGNTRYFPKPHTHALFPRFLLQCLQEPDANRALENHPWFSSRIVRACIDCYIAVEKCPYERVQVRYELAHAIKGFLRYDSLCDPVRDEFVKEGTVLERFSHMAVAEVNESVDQLIESLTEMNAMVKNGTHLVEPAAASASASAPSAPPTAAPARRAHRDRNDSSNNEEEDDDDDEEEADEAEEAATGPQRYRNLGGGLRSHIMLFNASMGMFIAIATQFPKGVSQNLVAQQISQMLARSLIAFAGPKSGSLKIDDGLRYDFKPREILSALVDCLTRFRRMPNFLRCLCQCGVPLPDLRAAMKGVIARRLLSEELTWKLAEMVSALDSIKQDVDDEATLWDDAPDFALDALLSTPLADPVALPSDIKDLDDLTYVNRDTIHHLLLSESKHPFTKEYLDEKMVDEFNKRPDVAAHREKVQRDIAAWLREAKAKVVATAANGNEEEGEKGKKTVAAKEAPSSAPSPPAGPNQKQTARDDDDDDEVQW